MQYIRWWCLLFFLFILSSCSTSHAPALIKQSARQRFITTTLDAPPFALFSLLKTGTDNTLYIFLEGDGRAWRKRTVVSDNPTPHQPLALSLALQSQQENVAYLGRPCQYTSLAAQPACQPAYWTSHRFAPAVVTSLNVAIDQLKSRSHTEHIVLIGYSGGGGLVALLAAMRHDVLGLITVAGNLDIERFNQHHGTTPMTGSLNPIAIAPELKAIPQWHFSGAADRIVPPFLAADFIAAIGQGPAIHHIVLDQVAHHRGWEKKWPEIEHWFTATLNP